MDSRSPFQLSEVNVSGKLIIKIRDALILPPGRQSPTRPVLSFRSATVWTIGVILLFSLLATACSGLAGQLSQDDGETLTDPTFLLEPSDLNQRSQDVARLTFQDLLSKNIKFDRISLEEGLSQSVINTILQDSKGFMWFGAQDGLNRYDGYEFKVYKNDPDNPGSLSVNFINVIYEDSSGVLWVGTRGGGLNQFDRESDRFTHFMADSENKQSLGSNFINAIFEDSDGHLWIGTSGGGLNRFDRETQEFVKYLNDPDDPQSISGDSISSSIQIIPEA